MLLVSGRFCDSKTIIPEAQEHFLTPSAHRDTHIFGGLGLSGMDITLITAAVIIGGEFHLFSYVAYYPALEIWPGTPILLKPLFSQRRLSM